MEEKPDSIRIGAALTFKSEGLMNATNKNNSQAANEATKAMVPQDPEDRLAETAEEIRDRNMDKTLADSFPTSDPPSSIPDPSGDDALPETDQELIDDELFRDLPAGQWAAIAVEDREVVGTGATREEAVQQAREKGHTEVSLVRVPVDPENPLPTAKVA